MITTIARMTRFRFSSISASTRPSRFWPMRAEKTTKISVSQTEWARSPDSISLRKLSRPIQDGSRASRPVSLVLVNEM